MIKKIVKVVNRMTEHGFYQFYQSFSRFKYKNIVEKVKQLTGNDEDEIELEPIMLEQLKKPIIIYACLNGIATIIFIVEILLFKWLKWRDSKHSNI